MRAFPTAICAALSVLSSMAVAAHGPKPAPGPAKQTGCAGMLATVWSGHQTQTSCVTRSKSPGQSLANGVVIYNGNQRQTRVFNSATDPIAPVPNLPPAVIAIVAAGSKNQSAKPMVIGISSSEPSAQPVVVNIASSGSGNQPVVVGVVSSGYQTPGAVEPVAIAVSPRPAKRPPYRPSALDQQ